MLYSEQPLFVLYSFMQKKEKKILQAVIIVLLLLSCQQLHSQRILDITKKYYRYDPFKSSFSFFVKHLTEDAALKEKNISKITDSTLYFFEGIYKSHSPFAFKPEKTKVVLAEREQPGDSIAAGKSILLYQIAGYAPKGSEGERLIQDEFRKFSRKYKTGFSEVKSRPFENKNSTSGEICDFLHKDLSFAPVTVAWSSDKGNTENIFVVTIRFIVVENYAYLPIPIPE